MPAGKFEALLGCRVTSKNTTHPKIHLGFKFQCCTEYLCGVRSKLNLTLVSTWTLFIRPWEQSWRSSETAVSSYIIFSCKKEVYSYWTVADIRTWQLVFIYCFVNRKVLDSSDDTVNRLWAEQSRNGGSGDFLRAKTLQTVSGAHPAW